MNYPEKAIAQQFYRDLKHTFSFRVSISIEGAGVHWYCKAKMHNRKCSIACFNYNTVYKQGPEYYIEFIDHENRLATGRTSDNKLALGAIKDWLDGQTLAELYTTYQFVDELKRKLQYVHSTFLNSDSAFEICTPVFEQSLGGFFEYTLSNDDRAIQYYIDGYSNPPKTGFGFKFIWDGCPVFYAYNEDLNAFKSLASDWLIKKINPSEISKLYPWIELFTIAAYYEKGEGITGEFIESWDAVEEFYAGSGLHFKEEILDFISSLRAKGFDKKLRAGTSLYSLILSRSRRHGLNQDQPRLLFSFSNEGDATLTGETLQLIEALSKTEIG